MSERLNKAKERYVAALHAMQSGVAGILGKIGPHTGECSPKHLRVGVNAAMIDCGAVAKLLVEKGIFTDEEYAEALAEMAEKDQKSYEEKLTEMTGIKVTLA